MEIIYAAAAIVGIILVFIVISAIVRECISEKSRKAAKELQDRLITLDESRKIAKAAKELQDKLITLEKNIRKLRDSTTAVIDMMREIVKTNDIKFSPRFEEILKKANKDAAEDNLKDDGSKYEKLSEYEHKRLLDPCFFNEENNKK